MSKGRFKIDKEVPVPPRPRTWRYPWENMEPGDSFFMPCKPEDAERVGNRAWTAGEAFAKRRGLDWKFTVRTVEGGARVWRVK